MGTAEQGEEENKRKYISFLGYDYSEYIKSEEDIKDFDRLCECEKESKKPLNECVEFVVECLNLDRKLRGKKGKVMLQKNTSLN